jgi:non-specific serine/threonine protein kinase
VQWLYFLSKLGLGACLADDMGLGKTIQVLALLLVLHRQSEAQSSNGNRHPSLLVAPASLLANWASEIARFAPSLKAVIAHPSELSANDLKSISQERLRDADLVITSYGSLVRPYILRRLKTDKKVIDDLPDKTEVKAFCNLSRKQAALYEQSVRSLRACSIQSKVFNAKAWCYRF